MTLITLRLSSVRFDLQLIGVKNCNPLDTSGDCSAKTRPQEHPFTLKDLMYEQITVFIKLAMSSSKRVISNDVVLSLVLFLCSLSLTICGFAWDKYMPDQTRQERTFEPNQLA